MSSSTGEPTEEKEIWEGTVNVEIEDRLKVRKHWADQTVQLQAEQELVTGNYVSTIHCELI